MKKGENKISDSNNLHAHLNKIQFHGQYHADSPDHLSTMGFVKGYQVNGLQVKLTLIVLNKKLNHKSE
jgi:hypothetical protein